MDQEKVEKLMRDFQLQIATLTKRLNERDGEETGGGKPIVQQAVSVQPPKTLDHKNGDVKESLSNFRTAWNNYVVASGLEEQSERKKIATLKCTMGEDALSYFSNLPIAEKDKDTVEKILDAMEEHLVPELNVVHERIVFNTTKQEDDESADQYININRLRKLIKTCKYGDMADDLLRDKLIISIRDKRLRARFYANHRLTLMEVINQLKATETAELQLETIDPKSVTHDVNKINREPRRQQNRQQSPHRRPQSSSRYNHNK
jgi:hypothetical protein